MKAQTNKNKKILVITPVPTHPQNAGNRVRIYTLLKELKKRGHEVHVLYDGGEFATDHVSVSRDLEAMRAEWDAFYFVPHASLVPLWRWGTKEASLYQFKVYKMLAVLFNISYAIRKILEFPDRVSGAAGRVLKSVSPSVYRFLKKMVPDGAFNTGVSPQNQKIDDRYNSALDRFIPRLQQKWKFDVVIAEYVFESKALLHFDDAAIKIIDTHDIFTDRKEKYEYAGLSDCFFSTTLDEEAKGFSRADIVLAIQDEEAAILTALTDKPVVTLGHIVDVKHLKEPPEDSILFLGAANTANIHAMSWFIDKVFSKIRENRPTARLIVAGKISDSVREREGVLKLGEVASVKEAYQTARVVINPTQVGTGLKIKSIEALGYGRPLVVTTHAGAGLGEENGFVRVDTPNKFASAVIALLKDGERRKDMSEKASLFAKKYNESITCTLDMVLEGNTKVRERSRICNSSSGKEKNFVIFTWARTGASTLSRILKQYDGIRLKEEPFNHNIGIKLHKFDKDGLEDHLKDIWKNYTGIKHNWGLGLEQNIHLLLDPDLHVVFLWRRNALQREVSLFISQETGKWGASDADREYILDHTFPGMDIGKAKKRIAEYRNEVERYRRLLDSFGVPYFALSYEDLYGEASIEEKKEQVEKLVRFLGRETNLSDLKHQKVMAALDPQTTKLNSKTSYERIPNIREVEAALGSDEIGWLFK